MTEASFEAADCYLGTLTTFFVVLDTLLEVVETAGFEGVYFFIKEAEGVGVILVAGGFVVSFFATLGASGYEVSLVLRLASGSYSLLLSPPFRSKNFLSH